MLRIHFTLNIEFTTKNSLEKLGFLSKLKMTKNIEKQDLDSGDVWKYIPYHGAVTLMENHNNNFDHKWIFFWVLGINWKAQLM